MALRNQQCQQFLVKLKALFFLKFYASLGSLQAVYKQVWESDDS